jgi:hypothetical protein
LWPCLLRQPSHPVTPPARAVSASPLCATIPAVASSPVHATSRPFPAPGAYKRATPSSPIPHTGLGHPLPPSSCPIERALPCPSPAPVSLALLPLLSYSLIHIVLELRHSLTNALHPSPPPIAPGSLAGDTAASARHLAVDRPPQAPSSKIGPTSMIPYPRLCLATTPPSQNRAPDGEPSRTSPAVEPTGSPPPSVARSTPLPPLLSLTRGPTPTTSARAALLLCGSARPPAHARWAEIPPPRSAS